MHGTVRFSLLRVLSLATHASLPLLPAIPTKHPAKIKETAVTLALSRDGSSGGVVRMAVITKEGVERHLTLGDKLPTFWEG